MDSESHRLARNAYMREWKRRNKTKVNKFNKRWKNKHRKAVRDRGREYMRVRAGTGEGYRRLWFTNIKARARKKGLPFDLTLDDLVFPDICPVLGITIKERQGKFSDSRSVNRSDCSGAWIRQGKCSNHVVSS